MRKKRLTSLALVLVAFSLFFLLFSFCEVLSPAHAASTTVSYEAESAANTLAGGAKVTACSACSGGKKVGYIGDGGTLQFNKVLASSAGTATVTIYYVDGDAGRSALISVNGGAATTTKFHGATWTVVQNLTISVALKTGSNTIKFSNAAAPAPDIDRITVTTGTTVTPTPTVGTTPTPTSTPVTTNPYGDPNLVSMFDGKTLKNWTSSQAGLWVVQNGAIHDTGTARGWIYYNTQVGSFRWIFDVRQDAGAHYPSALIWGTTAPLLDALSALQFGLPNGNHWDYRPGHDNIANNLFKTIAHTTISQTNWAQCEIDADQTTGMAKMACCPLAAGATTCKAVEVLTFVDKTAGRVSPLALQVHNAGLLDDYKSLYVESPVKLKPNQFITT
jgi:hypothetical protein